MAAAAGRFRAGSLAGGAGGAARVPAPAGGGEAGARGARGSGGPRLSGAPVVEFTGVRAAAADCAEHRTADA